jgi:rod shape determining protein RodA
MLEYAGSQRAGLRAEREAPRLLSVARSIDWVLFVGVAALVVVGLWGRRGASRSSRVPSDPSYYLNRQILYACVGAVVLVAAALIDRTSTGAIGAPSSSAPRCSSPSSCSSGARAHGSTRWINLGFFTFQPSEFGKLLFVLALAGMLAERQRALTRWETTAEGRRGSA